MPGWALLRRPDFPNDTIERIRALVTEAIKSRAIRDKLTAQLMEPIPDTPAEFRAGVDADIVRWSPVIAAPRLQFNNQGEQ